MRKNCESSKRIKSYEREFIIIPLRIFAACEWHSSSKPVRRAGIEKGRPMTMGKTKLASWSPSWLINYLFFSLLLAGDDDEKRNYNFYSLPSATTTEIAPFDFPFKGTRLRFRDTILSDAAGHLARSNQYSFTGREGCLLWGISCLRNALISVISRVFSFKFVLSARLNKKLRKRHISEEERKRESVTI